MLSPDARDVYDSLTPKVRQELRQVILELMLIHGSDGKQRPDLILDTAHGYKYKTRIEELITSCGSGNSNKFDMRIKWFVHWHARRVWQMVEFKEVALMLAYEEDI